MAMGFTPFVNLHLGCQNGRSFVSEHLFQIGIEELVTQLFGPFTRSYLDIIFQCPINLCLSALLVNRPRSRLVVPLSTSVSYYPLELIFTNVWGPTLNPLEKALRLNRWVQGYIVVGVGSVHTLWLFG